MRNEEMREFGEALARYRSEAGLNQRQLAAAIGLDSTQVNKIERGHRPPLDAKYMKPLVHALRLSRSEALDLVQKADLSPKVLDFMDEVQTAVHPTILRKKAARSRLQAKLLPGVVHPALALPDSLFDNLGGDIEEIKGLIASTHLTDEEEKIVKSTLDTAKRLLLFIEDQRKMRKDG